MTTNNKLIAEFMGYQVVDNPRVINGENFFQYIDKENKKYTYEKSLLRYNDSWDWLMPVVEKINTNYDIQIDIGHNWVEVRGDIQMVFDYDNTINLTYKAVVYIINIINQNK